MTKVIINEVEIDLKYCNTCKIIRSPRSFHCDICGHCIKKHDHHCPFVGNCIGENNINKFFYFLVSVYVHSLAVFTISLVIFLIRRTQSLWDYRDFINILVFGYAAMANFTMLFMLLMQTYLISVNITTNECCRGKISGKNPFDKDCGNNCKEVFKC